MSAGNSGLILVSLAVLALISIIDIGSSYGQSLANTYDNQNCGVSIQYPSDWKTEETQDSPVVTNYIVDIQPANEEGFNNVVGIQMSDISTLSDKSFEGVKDFEEESLSIDEDAGLLKVESSESTQLAGYPSQKVVYSETVSGDKKMDVFTVAFDREYKVTYDANSGYYDKQLSVFEEMLKTFKINQPTFQGITC
jgi:hypothetical protein